MIRLTYPDRAIRVPKGLDHSRSQLSASCASRQRLWRQGTMFHLPDLDSERPARAAAALGSRSFCPRAEWCGRCPSPARTACMSAATIERYHDHPIASAAGGHVIRARQKSRSLRRRALYREYVRRYARLDARWRPISSRSIPCSLSIASFGAISQAVVRAGGKVNQYLGDGLLLALFLALTRTGNLRAGRHSMPWRWSPRTCPEHPQPATRRETERNVIRFGIGINLEER